MGDAFSLDDKRRSALTHAAHWQVQLGTQPVDENDRRAWQLWRDSDIDHAWAWAQIESLQGVLSTVPSDLTANALHLAQERRQDGVDRGRRRLIKGAALALTSGYVLHAVGPAWPGAAAVRSGIGEVRSETLPDGSRITLDTRTAVSLDFDAGRRLLRLHEGDVLVEVAPEGSSPASPLVVALPQGRVQATSGRFSVRRYANDARVAVFDSAVQVRPTAAHPVRLPAGRQLRWSGGGINAQQAADETLVAWTRGRLVVSDWRLADFVSEVGRYRAGLTQCAAAVADLRISGAFPLIDTGEALRALEHALPVTVRQPSRYWTRVIPRA